MRNLMGLFIFRDKSSPRSNGWQTRPRVVFQVLQSRSIFGGLSVIQDDTSRAGYFPSRWLTIVKYIFSIETFETFGKRCVERHGFGVIAPTRNFGRRYFWVLMRLARHTLKRSDYILSLSSLLIQTIYVAHGILTIDKIIQINNLENSGGMVSNISPCLFLCAFDVRSSPKTDTSQFNARSGHTAMTIQSVFSESNEPRTEKSSFDIRVKSPIRLDIVRTHRRRTRKYSVSENIFFVWSFFFFFLSKTRRNLRTD